MMAFLVIAAVAFLAGAVSAVFLATAVTIRRGDRPERILNATPCSSETCTCPVPGTGSWPEVPVYRPGPRHG